VVYIDTQRPILGILKSYNFENATAGTVIGQVPLASTGSEITALRIEGEGADKFNVDLNRNVTVAEGAEFDFETQTEFTFRVIATNSFGESDPVPLYIQVADVDDSIRIAGASFSVNEDTPPSSVVGQLTILGLGGRTLSHFVITGAGSEWFSIDNTGGIYTTASANFNRSVTSSYRLSVVAIDSLGLPSNTATLDVYITDSLNTVPLLTNVSLSLMDTQMTGTVVGNVRISSAVSVVEQVWIEGEGGKYFSIDTQGFIYLVNPLDFLVKRHYELTIYAKNTVGLSLPVRLDIDISPEMDITPPVLKLQGLKVWDGDTRSILELATGEIEWPISKLSYIKSIPMVTVTDNVDEPNEVQLTIVANVTLTKTSEVLQIVGESNIKTFLTRLNDLATIVIIYTAVDSSGNQSQASQQLTIVDVTPPNIQLSLSELSFWAPHYRLRQGDTYTENVTVSDNVDASIDLNIMTYFTESGASETEVSSINTNITGYYRIKYSAEDGSGNVANKVRHIIIAYHDQALKALNDTGIVFSGNYPDLDSGYPGSGSDPSANNLDCADESASGQDCKTGLDTSVGFQFTKLDQNGAPMTDQTQSYESQPWHCVLDNNTGLMWEVKNDSPTLSSLHSVRDEFTWYATEDALLLTGGARPILDGRGLIPRPNYYPTLSELRNKQLNERCTGYDTNNASSYCNTEAFIKRVNASNSGKGLCGFSDWRLPNITEALSVTNYSSVTNNIYFPNRLYGSWSSQRLFDHVWGYQNGRFWRARPDEWMPAKLVRTAD